MESGFETIKIPNDIQLSWERNFSFLGTFLIARQHMKALWKELDIGYSMCAFFHSHGQVKFYRSESDEENFNRTLGERCLKEKDFANHVAELLRECTDEMNKFFKKEKGFSKKNINNFFQLADRHFAFHLGVFWSADWLGQSRSAESDRILNDILLPVRKYNEFVLPLIEKWLLEYNTEYRCMTPDECREKVLNGKNISEETKEARDEASFVYMDRYDGIKLFSCQGEEALSWRDKFEEKFLTGFDSSRNELKGRTIFPGVYKGIARVVQKFDDFKNLKDGEVLVAPMAIPAYYNFIKNSGAIVVDEGAVLSHASILAREFKIPCVMGTKIGTSVLRDGDLVEVDGDRGIVKILKRK